MTEVGSGTVVGEGVTAKDVWQGTIGSVAKVEAPEPAVFDVEAGTDVVELERDLEVDVDVDVDVGVGVDVDVGWDVLADVALGVDGPPQPAATTSPVRATPTIHPARRCRTRPAPSRTPGTD